MNAFDTLPDESRLWIFMFGKDLSPNEQQIISGEMEVFLTKWNAHGAPVTGGFKIVENRFLVVAADPHSTEVSGCSIDTVFRVASEAAKKADVPLSGNSSIFHRNGGGILESNRADFGAAVQSGKITPSVEVFDTTIQSLGEFRSGKLCKKFAESWHAKAF